MDGQMDVKYRQMFQRVYADNTRAYAHTNTNRNQQFRTQRNQVDVKTNQAQTTAFSDRHTCFPMALYRRMISCTKYSLPERLNWPCALSNK